MADQTPEKQNFTPFPRKKRKLNKGPKLIIDHEKVRDQYINGEAYSWKDFCAIHNYDPGPYVRANFFEKCEDSFTEWKLEWRRRKNEEAEESITPITISTTKLLSIRKAKFSEDWHKTANVIKNLMHMQLQLKATIATAAMNDPLVRQGLKPMPEQIDDTQIAIVAKTALMIQELERKSFIELSEQEIEEIKKLKDQTEVDEPNEIVVEDLAPAKTGAVISEDLAKYFDQFEKKPEAIETTAVPIEKEDQV